MIAKPNLTLQFPNLPATRFFCGLKAKLRLEPVAVIIL